MASGITLRRASRRVRGGHQVAARAQRRPGQCGVVTHPVPPDHEANAVAGLKTWRRAFRSFTDSIWEIGSCARATAAGIFNPAPGFGLSSVSCLFPQPYYGLSSSTDPATTVEGKAAPRWAGSRARYVQFDRFARFAWSKIMIPPFCVKWHTLPFPFFYVL